MSRALSTTDHETIKRWVESRNGHPTVVKATQSSKPGQGGLLRIDFNKPDESLKEVSWDDFFDTFDSNNLAFLYQEKTASGRKSRFNKFVARDSVDTSDSEEDASDDDAGSTRARAGTAAGAAAGSTAARQASARDEEEAEEADEEDAMDEDEDFAEDDEDYDDESDDDESYDEDEDDEDDGR